MQPPFPRGRRLSYVEQLEARIAPATIIVQNLDDSGPGSLRQAVETANGTPALDTIIFKAGLVGTVALASEISISAPLSIKGPGGAKIVLSGGEATRIFLVSDGIPAVDSPASFTGLVFTHGEGGLAGGGAIRSTEGVTVTSCLFTDNFALFGGAIQVDGEAVGAKVKITSSQFIGNETSNGGGALNLELKAASTVSIVKSTFLGNSGRYGGAVSSNIDRDEVANAVGKTLISGSVFVGNSAVTWGGALRTSSDNVTILNSRITGNTVSDGEGGGLYFGSGNLAISGSTISNNTAESGGGIFFDRLDVGSITKTVFANNRATDTGGNGGGAMALHTTLFNTVNALTVTASTFVGNTSAAQGGAISFQNGGSLKLAASIFTGNRAAGAGGAVSTNGTMTEATALTVLGGTFTDNRGASGGAIGSAGDGAISIASAKFRSNRTVTGGGGALYLRSSTGILVTKSLFSENFSADDGGGLVIGGIGTATLTGLTFLNNTANDKGGGFAIFQGTTTISKTTVRGNHGAQGGGLAIDASTVIIQSSIISGNTATTSHGGVFKSTPGEVTVATTTKIFANLAPVTPDSN